MADTVRTRAALLSLLADQHTHSITAQNIRDMLVSLHGNYGELYVEDASTPQTFNIAPALLTAWAANGNSSGTTPDHTNDKITVLSAGLWNVVFHASIINGQTNITYKFYIRVNGTEQSGGTYIKTASADVVNVKTSRVLSLSANDEVTIYGEADANSKDATITDGVLLIYRLA